MERQTSITPEVATNDHLLPDGHCDDCFHHPSCRCGFFDTTARHILGLLLEQYRDVDRSVLSLLDEVFEVTNATLCPAIVIACISSFRQVFVNAHNRRRHDRQSKRSSLKRLLPWLHFPSWNIASPLKRSPKSSNCQDSSVDWRTPTHIAPLQSIHIDPHISVAASNFRLEDY